MNHNQTFREASEKYHNGELSPRETVEKIRDATQALANKLTDATNPVDPFSAPYVVFLLRSLIEEIERQFPFAAEMADEIAKHCDRVTLVVPVVNGE